MKRKSKSSEDVASNQFVEKFCSKMTCVIEYDNPDDTRGDYSGSFKLKNDPKVSRFGTNSVMYCGSKLFSEAMIGIVLFNGQNTRIFRQNMINNSWHDWTTSKKHTLGILRNTFLSFHLVLAIMLSTSNCLLMFSNEDMTARSLMIEGNSTWVGYLRKIVLIFVINVSLTPLLLFLVIDVSFMIVSILLRIELSNTCRKRRKNRLNSNKSSSSQEKVSSGSPSMMTGNVQTSPLKDELMSLKYPELHLDSDRRKLEILHSSVNSPTHSALAQMHPSHNYQVYHLESTKKAEEDMHTTFRIFTIDTIFNLANVDHVVFDKTDTLTYGSLKIERLATFKKDYLFDLPTEAFASMVAESRSNQARFSLSDSDDSLHFMENDEYSEESQE